MVMVEKRFKHRKLVLGRDCDCATYWYKSQFLASVSTVQAEKLVFGRDRECARFWYKSQFMHV